MNIQVSTPFDAHHDPGNTILLTMWETTRLKAEWVANVNRFRAVIVPCGAVAGWFRDSGVTVPIRVVPLGIDPAVFHPTVPEPKGVVRFGCSGRLAHGGVRKGIGDVVRAFRMAFSGQCGVELWVKVLPDCELSAIEGLDDPRITVIREAWTDPRRMADFYRSLSVFVSASRGEGWGYQPHEAMACGRPVIAPFWGGHTGYLKPDNSYWYSWDLEPAAGLIYDGCGDWCVPDINSLVAAMKYVSWFGSVRRHHGEQAAIDAGKLTIQAHAAGVARVLKEFGYSRQLIIA